MAQSDHLASGLRKNQTVPLLTKALNVYECFSVGCCSTENFALLILSPDRATGFL